MRSRIRFRQNSGGKIARVAFSDEFEPQLAADATDTAVASGSKLPKKLSRRIRLRRPRSKQK